MQGLINGLLVEFNDLIDMLQSLHDDGLRAQQLAGIEDAGMGELGSINQELTSFRDDGLAQFNEQSAMLFGIVSKISMIIGGGLMATGVLGIIGPATLVRMSCHDIFDTGIFTCLYHPAGLTRLLLAEEFPHGWLPHTCCSSLSYAFRCLGSPHWCVLEPGSLEGYPCTVQHIRVRDCC